MKPTHPQPHLLPCPFCGATPTLFVWMDEDLWSHNDVEWEQVRCACGVENDSTCEGYEEDETATAMWNKRVAADAAPPLRGETVKQISVLMPNWLSVTLGVVGWLALIATVVIAQVQP